VLPEKLVGLPFTPVEFDKLTATAYIEENGNFSRVAWSFRAAEVRGTTNPQSRNGSPSTQKANA
jgi:hypothetical protein